MHGGFDELEAFILINQVIRVCAHLQKIATVYYCGVIRDSLECGNSRI
jgi:hypothetical protein